MSPFRTTTPPTHRRPAAHSARRAAVPGLLLAVLGALLTATASPATAATPTLEAETAFTSGGVTTTTGVQGFSGNGYLTGLNRAGARAVLTAEAPRAATYETGLRYRTPGGQATALTVDTGTGDPVRVALPATDGAWSTAPARLPLRAGLNHLHLRPAADGALDLDGIDLTGAAAPTARGAAAPTTAYEMEDAETDGRVLDADRTYLTVSSEASGRSAVVLESTGDQATLTLTEPANALVLRHSLPDSDDGRGTDATLSLLADGEPLPQLDLTSRHSWVYGEYPYGNDPSQGDAHRFFDETRLLLDRTLPAGTELTFRKDASDTADSYTLDLVETEVVPEPLTRPDDYLDAAGLGVVADDEGDDTDSINAALREAKDAGKGLWLDEGTYRISGEITLDGVQLAGAGMWYTDLRGTNGKGVLFGRGGTNSVTDLSITGDVTYRDDAAFDAAVEGDFGEGSTLQNLWIQHTKVGLWIDGPTTGLYASGLRIRDVFADGVNLHKGTSDTVVSHSSIRNTGDDGLAMWSEDQPVTDSAFRNNTVQLPMLANGAALYGGSGNSIEDNVIADTVTGASGIAVSTRFGLPFSGTATVARNTLDRTGGYEPNWGTPLGALWVYADTSEITTPVIIEENDILDSTYSGLLVSWQKNVSDLRVSDTTIDGAGSHGIEIDASGHGTFSGVTVSSTADTPLDLAGGFTVERGSGNSGW